MKFRKITVSRIDYPILVKFKDEWIELPDGAFTQIKLVDGALELTLMQDLPINQKVSDSAEITSLVARLLDRPGA